jgi:methionine-rich copper-binding protein CopC
MPCGHTTRTGIGLFMALALAWGGATLAHGDSVVLENPSVALTFDGNLGAVRSIRDKQLGVTYEINGIAFTLATSRGNVQGVTATSNSLAGDTLTFTFETAAFNILLHYRLRAGDRFIEKWLELTTKDAQPCQLQTVTLEDASLGPQFQQIHYHDDNTIWQCPVNLFLRGTNGGCFAGIEYPYWAWNIDGNSGFSLGFAPNYQLPAAATFVSEKYFLGVYRKEGIYRYSQGPYPGAVSAPYVSFSGTGLSQHFKSGVIPAAAVNAEVLDWGEVWAMQQFMRQVQPDDLLLPEDGFWVWQNGWWAGLSSPDTAALDRLKQAGVHDIMTSPTWYGRGIHPNSPAYLTQMRVDPIGFPKDNAPGEYTTNFVAPPAWDAFHQYGESNGVHVSSFSTPFILFNAKPEWAHIDAKSNVTQYIDSNSKVSCPAVKAYMDHMLNVLDNVITNYQTRWWGFDGRWLSYWEVPAYRTGSNYGFEPCYATDHGHLPGDNLYMEWKNIQSFLQSLRERHPRLCLEAYYGLKRGGPWALRYLNADENYYESNGAVMNRFQTWHNQNDRFRPVYKNYAAIFGGSPAAFRDNVLSSISTTSYCQIGPGYSDLALQENRDFLAQWRAWATTNHAYLKVKRDLFDCPGFKRLDGSAHIIGDRGFLFLFPSGSGLTPRALVPMNRWIGLDEDPAALYRITEVYPQPGRLIGTYRYGDDFPFDMSAASPVVLSIDPAPAGAQPEQNVPLLDASQVVSVAAFSSTDPGTGTQWTNYPYHLNSMVTATWNESSGEMGISQSSAGGSGLFPLGSSRLPTAPVTMRVKQLNRTGGGWGIVGLMISAARQPGYFTTTDDTYTLALAALGGTSVRYEVRRTYLDGTGNYQLYVGPAFDLAASGPVRLDIVRNEAGNYEFLANGNLLYTSGGAAGDFYDAAAKDSLVYHQIVQAGDGAMTATVDNFGIDSIPPGLSTLSPADGATGVATAADLSATFGEPVRKGAGNITLKKSADHSVVESFDVSSSPRITFSGATLTIDPTSVLAGLTGYYVQIDPTAVKDLAGNSFAGITDTTTTAWSFTTGPPDTAAPTVASLSPANGSSAAVISANLRATFNEPVQKGVGNITLRKSADNSLVETFDVASSPRITVSGATLTIDPTSLLETFTGYYVQIAADAIRDISGNSFAGISGTTAWSFTTAGDAWTPAELPNKALWLDAADAATVVLSGSTVSQWNDKSGNGRNVAQANATYKPNYTTAALNENPAITFDGSDDCLIGNVPDSVFPANITLVHVFVPLSAASTKGMLQIASALGSTNPWLLQQQSSPTQFKHYVDGNYRITETIATSSPCISVLTFSGSQWISWLNGTQGAAYTGGRGSNTGNALYLGNGYNGYWNGRFGEVIATTSSLATSDRQKLEGYLAWKWGLQANLPADHPYRNDEPGITGTTLPSIATLNPANNATGIAVDANLEATFSKNIQKGTGSITLRKSADNSLVETFDVASSPRITVSGATLTIDPTSVLAGLTGYYVQIDAGAIRDLAGNSFAGISGTTTWSFTTAGDAWTPQQLSGRVLWLDASDATSVVLNGAAVSQWNDKSANGRSVSQGTAASQPAYVSSGLNGMSVVRFDGANDALLGGVVFASGNSSSVLCVLKYNNATSANQSIYSNEDGTYGTPAIYLQANAGTVRLYGGVYASDGTYTSGQVEINAVSRGPATATGNMWRDGSQVLTNATIGTNTTNRGFLLGSLVSSLFGNFDLAELIALDGEISAADRQKTEGYLAWKWGLQAKLPVDHPYKNAAPGGTTPTLGYASWQTANGAAGQTLAQDHDGDGVANGIEYFLFGNTHTTGFTALPGVSNNSGVFSVTWTKAASYTGTYGTDFRVETSDALTGAWTPEPLGVNVILTGNAVKYTFPSPHGTKKFTRLVVAGP